MTFFGYHSLCIEHLVVPPNFHTLQRERHVAKKVASDDTLQVHQQSKKISNQLQLKETVSSSNFSKNLTQLCNNIASVQDSEYCKLEF